MRILLTIFLLAAWSSSYSQNQSEKVSVSDFFIPFNANKIDYYANYKTPPYIRNNREVFFLQKEKGYDIYDSQLMGDQITSKSIRTVILTNSEVKMLRVKVESMLVAPKLRTFPVPVVILKLPIDGKPATWISKSDVGDIESCIATFSPVKYKREEVQAIKVVRTSKTNKIKTVEYYAKGIGLFKLEFYDPVNKITQDVNEAYKVSKVYVP